MKRIIVSIAVLAISVALCEAGEIDGEWGLGVGIYGPSTFTVTRGLSKRTALLGNISLSVDRSKYTYDEGTSESEDVNWSTSTGVNIEWRRYLREEKQISPYFGIGPSSSYSKLTDSYYSNKTLWSGGMAFAIGVEYFVNEFLSLSTHLPLIQYNFNQQKTEYTDGRTSQRREHHFVIANSSSLLVRLYF